MEMGFENKNFLWEDDEFDKASFPLAYEPLSDDTIVEVEKELGFKLPASYKELCKVHNGGRPVNTFIAMNDYSDYWKSGYLMVTCILSIGRGSLFSIIGDYPDRISEECSFPNIGVIFGMTEFPGHGFLFFDYRSCGPDGEPCVRYAEEIRKGDGWRLIKLADNFDEFLDGLKRRTTDLGNKAS